jgi:pyruvate formate lyase activating enzyme
MFSPGKCIQCGSCVEACPEKAISLSADGISFDDALCKLCGKCAEVCPTKAIEISGKKMTADEIMAIIEKERIFFDQSGGGVTFSGGEPLLHPELLHQLLDECRQRKIHTAIDTAGNVRTQTLLEVAKKADIFLYDLKLMHPTLHKQWTKSSNSLILLNLEALAAAGATIIIRIPLVGGVNDSSENIAATARFITQLKGESKEVHLFPYHAIAQNKFMKLGRSHQVERLQEPDHETQERAISIFAEYGIMASVGG